MIWGWWVGVSFLFYSIHILHYDYSGFTVYCDVPRFTFSPFPYILPSIRQSFCPLTIIFPFLPFPYILCSNRWSVCSFTMLFPILPIPYINSSIRPSVCSFTMFLPILVLSYIFHISCVPKEVSYWYQTPVFWPITGEDKRRKERRMSICLIEFPISVLGEPYLYHQSVCFTRIWEDCWGVPVVDGVCETCEIVKR